MGKKIQTIGRYQMVGHTLGKGAFARVEMAVHSVAQIKVGIKIIDTRKFADQQARELFNREAKILSQLNHPNIVRMYETLKAGSLYCIVTEYAPGGELLGYVRSFKEERLTESQARPFIRQLVSALNYMHERGVVHRDLKMENILLDEAKKNVKIIDFGLSNVCANGQLLRTHCGSPEYAAPELLSPKKGYGPEVDLWSLSNCTIYSTTSALCTLKGSRTVLGLNFALLFRCVLCRGVIMYALVTGRLPFWSPYADHGRKQKLLEQIEKGLTEKHDAVMKNLTPDCRQLIKQLVEPNPLHRIPLKEVMLHPWLTRNGKTPFVPFKALPRNHTMRTTVCEKLSQLMKMERSEVEAIIAENRAHEITTMFNLLMDDARKGTEYAELDHTLPITYVITEPKRSAVDNWKLIKESLGAPSKANDRTDNHNSKSTTHNGPNALHVNNVAKSPRKTNRPNFLHLSSADNVMAANRRLKGSTDEADGEKEKARSACPTSDARSAQAPSFNREEKAQPQPPAVNAQRTANTCVEPVAVLPGRLGEENACTGEQKKHRRERSEGTVNNAFVRDSLIDRAKAALPERLDFKRAPKALADDDVLEPQPSTSKSKETAATAGNAKATPTASVNDTKAMEPAPARKQDGEKPEAVKAATVEKSSSVPAPVQPTVICEDVEKSNEGNSVSANFSERQPTDQSAYGRVRSLPQCADATTAPVNARSTLSSVTNESSSNVNAKPADDAASKVQSAKQFTLDTDTIDIIVSKLLVAAGKQPSIWQQILGDSKANQTAVRDASVASENCHLNKRVLTVQQNSPVKRNCVNRFTSPDTTRRAKSCLSNREDSFSEKPLQRNYSSHKIFNTAMTQTDCDWQPVETPRSRRRQRFTKKKRKQRVVFLQHSPSSGSFDADDEGDDDRRRLKIHQNERRPKVAPVVCSRCNCSSSATTLLVHHPATNSYGNLLQAHSTMRMFNGDSEQKYCASKRCLMPSHHVNMFGVKRDSLTPHPRKTVTLIQSHSQEPVVS